MLLGEIRANSAFHPSCRVGQWVVIHGLRGWRQLNGRPGLRMAVWLQIKVCWRRLSRRPIGCTPALSVTQNAPLQLRYAACGATHVLYAFAFTPCVVFSCYRLSVACPPTAGSRTLQTRISRNRISAFTNDGRNWSAARVAWLAR